METTQKNQDSRFTCESIKIFNRLKNASIDNNRKLFSGKGCVVSLDEIDRIDNLDFKLVKKEEMFGITKPSIDVSDKYDFLIVVGRSILYSKFVSKIMELVKPNGYIVFYCANPYYTVVEDETLPIFTKIFSSEIMQSFLVRIKNIRDFDFEIVDAMSIPMKIPFVSCDLEKNEYFYQVVIRVVGNLFGKKNLDDEAQLVSLDD